MFLLLVHSPHFFFLCVILISDNTKSEERQKLAKERREEKAKYLGECKQGVGREFFFTQEKSTPWCWGGRR